jgi:hypothetical protein
MRDVCGVLFIRWRGAAAAARGADLNKVELPGLISFSRIGVRRRWRLRMDLALVGRVAAAAPEFPGRCVIAGLLRTAVGESAASSLSVGAVPRQRPGAPTSIRWSCRG